MAGKAHALRAKLDTGWGFNGAEDEFGSRPKLYLTVP
jgi:hypothetical protein